MADTIKAWAEIVNIPTYKIGIPDKNPMFLEKRVYQGSSGAVYPHPVIDRVFDEKEDKEYTALYLENRYLKIMILPEIGGRVQMALDKTNGYHFVYYNRVIKPALVGLAGPWISGGIEFNWPQHHRPSTFDPLNWTIEDQANGSKTIWCSEIESMFHTRGLHGFTLYPERAYLEVKVQLYNRTAEPQTFLWWANPAVSVHDDYQSVFPPDVHAVMDHGKRDVSTFPIATGTYYKVNYAPGTDISRYKNIPVPTSYMAYHSDFDFLGDYDYRASAGMLHIANHHVVPGKKQWTWGNGEFGKAWDRQLTDEDGPYIELMCGAYTDNQPDFSWIQPGEEKSFTQIFMPYQKIGPACNANQHVVVRLQVENGQAEFGVYVTSPRQVIVKLDCAGQALFSRTVELEPEIVLKDKVTLPPGTRLEELTLGVYEGETLLLKYAPLAPKTAEIPSPAKPALPPEEIESVEELFLNGLHLEQYRHATYAPEPYYLEALRRDPGDSRCNNAMGLLLYRRGRFFEAESYFRKAVKRLTVRNPNPYDGEPYYNLGLSLSMQARYLEAQDAFYKAVWNAAVQDAAYYELACLASRAGNFDEALELAGRCLNRNACHYQARHLKAALLRLMGEADRSRVEIELNLEKDPMEYGSLWERSLLVGDDAFEQMAGANPELRIVLALDYAHAGLFTESVKLLEQSAKQNPMAAYTLGWIYSQSGYGQLAEQTFAQAALLPPDYCFPNRLEDVIIFQAACRANPMDARAPYYLGNFWYAHRQYDDAIACWKSACVLDPDFATVNRNLGLAYYNKRKDVHKALDYYGHAFALDRSDARILYEFDQLLKRLNHSPLERQLFLEQNFNLVKQRDDLSVEYIHLLLLSGETEAAFAYLMRRTFHPWEGGEGKVTGLYVTSLVERAKTLIATGEARQAVDLLMQAQVYPPNLGEGKLYGTQENHIFYFLGCAFETLAEMDEAQRWFERASVGLSEPVLAVFYNDQPPDMILYQGLALLKLGLNDQASSIFKKLMDFGQAHLDDQVALDYFAVSLPDFLVFDADLNEHNRLHCFYMMGLGALGSGDLRTAQKYFDSVLAMDSSHLGATLHNRMAHKGLYCL
jgi:tetratricopeptide (TPR) repeat protein